MGLLGAAFGLGFVIGPAIGGGAWQYLGSAAPGLVAAGLSLLNFASAWAILPESLHPDHRTERRGLGFEAIARGLADRRLRPLMLVWGIFPFAFAGYTAALPYHAAAAFGRTLGPEAVGGAYDAAGARAAFLAAAGVMALAWLATLGLERQVTDVGMTGQANS